MSRKVALVHDYLREYGGAERVLEALHTMYPEAPVYTAFTDPSAMGIHWQKFADWDIRPTWLAKIPGIRKIYSPLRVFAPKAFADLDLSAYDLVISSSNAYEAKAVSVPDGVHICYCHTPPRALYGYSTMTDWKKNPVVRVVGTIINHYMRVVDFQVAQKVDLFIANSVETKKRITKFYRRESTVVFPPVQVSQMQVQRKTDSKASNSQDYYLYVNRLAFAKHPDMAVEACLRLGEKLVVVGSGPMLEDLQRLAADSELVTFAGAVSDEQLHGLYAGAKALLYPVEDEDFGMVPIEAMGHGVPVIAHRSGGPTETVIENQTGVFFDELTVEGLSHAITDFKASQKKGIFNPHKISQHAQQFSVASFKKKIEAVVATTLQHQ